MCSGLVHSQVDAGLKEDAAKSCATAAHLARKHVPNKIVDVLKLQVLSLPPCPQPMPPATMPRLLHILCHPPPSPLPIFSVFPLKVYYQLGDAKMFEREIKSSPELSVINKLYKVKWSVSYS